MALRIWASRPETSYASSVGVLPERSLTGGDESERACALFALPAFLRRFEEDVKVREAYRGHCAEVGAWRMLHRVSFRFVSVGRVLHTLFYIATQLLCTGSVV
jgi:hypothetical protein